MVVASGMLSFVQVSADLASVAARLSGLDSLLGELNGIESAMVSSIEGHAVVKYTPEVLSAETLEETIGNAGFEVDGFPEQEIAVCRLRIKGMENKVTISYDPDITGSRSLIQCVKDASYDAKLYVPPRRIEAE